MLLDRVHCSYAGNIRRYVCKHTTANSDLHGDLCGGRVADKELYAGTEVWVEGVLPDRSDGFAASTLHNAVRVSTCAGWGGRHLIWKLSPI